MRPLCVGTRFPLAPIGLTPEDWAYSLDRRPTMSELDARYARGQDTRRMFGGGTITSAGSAPGAWDVSPILSGYSAKRSLAPSGAVTPSAPYSAR